MIFNHERNYKYIYINGEKKVYEICIISVIKMLSLKMNKSYLLLVF